MEYLSIIAGVVVLLWTISDILSTVFVIGDGAGPQSGRVADRTWRLALRFHDSSSLRAHRRLRRVGPCIILLVLVSWVGQLIAGWALIFVPSSLTGSGSDSVTFLDRVVFAGRTIVGRAGNTPGLSASKGPWELVHGFAGLSGVTMVTIGLAYILPILAGVALKRSLAVHVHALGNSVDDMKDLIRSTPGGGQIDLHFIALTPLIATVAERYRSYPVLHYFHSTDAHASLAPAIAKLCLLHRHDVAADADDVDRTVTGPLARTIHDLYGALGRLGLLEFADRNGLDVDRDQVGVDVLDSGHYGFPADDWLKAYVMFDGWDWNEVVAGDAARTARTRN